jgi:hypothetical protein
MISRESSMEIKSSREYCAEGVLVLSSLMDAELSYTTATIFWVYSETEASWPGGSAATADPENRGSNNSKDNRREIGARIFFINVTPP